MPQVNVMPLHPPMFFEFLATPSKVNPAALPCIIKAIVKYSKACTKAAATMEKEINACLAQHPVHHSKPKITAKPKTRAKRK